VDRFQEIQNPAMTAFTAIFGSDDTGSWGNLFQTKGKRLETPIEVKGSWGKFLGKGSTRGHPDTSSHERNGALKGFWV
jgi:hypothetical protein